MKYEIFFTFFCLLSIGYTQQIQELPETVNKTACIPLKNLRDAMVQRGLGEARKIRKVQLYLMGSGNVDVSVAIALRFLDEGYTKPIFHKCGEYHGTANNVMVTVSCIDEENPESEGYTGYAVYAKFHGDVNSQVASICQMDIVLYDKNAQKSQQAIIIFIGIIFGLLFVAIIGAVFWYFWSKKKKKDQRELAEGVQYWEEEIMVEHEGSKKQQSTTLLDDDDDDEVFLR